MTASERALIHKGDWFEESDGTAWRVVDPWTPMETDGPLVPFVWIEGQDGGDRWIECERFDTQIETGDFRSIDAPTATDGGERPAECDCQTEIGERPCGACYRAGFNIPASKDPEAQR